MLVHLLIIIMILFGSIYAYMKKSLNGIGAIAAFLLGSVLYISGGVTFLVALFTFFASSTILTRYKDREKKKLEKVLYDKTGTRDHVQVLANGGAALLIAIYHMIFPDENTIIALFTAFAACNADTWASEIGVLSKRSPVSILTFKPMSRGISGGVTFLGTLSAFGGSFLVAITYVCLRLVNNELDGLLQSFLYILILGFLGSIFDSLMGATVQPLYRNPHTGILTEKKQQGAIKNIKIKGFEFFSNDMVNLISSGLAAFSVFVIVGM